MVVVKVDVTKTNEITLKYTSQEELNAKRVAGKAEKDKLKTEKV